MKHTPLPWSVSKNGMISGPEGWLGVATAHGDNEEEIKANAAFIVQAVNAYDDLMTALQEIQQIAFQGGQNAQASIRLVAEQAIAQGRAA